MTPSRARDAWIAQAEPLARQFRAVAVLCVAGFTTAVADLDVRSIAKGLLIPRLVDQNSCAQSRSPMDMMVQGASTSLFQAAQQCSTRLS